MRHPPLLLLKASLPALLLPLLVFLVFGRTWGYEFINFDDPLYVTENHYVLQGITWEGFKWALKANESGHWQPLTYVSHMIDVELFGLHPGRHHLMSVSLHMLSTHLLYFLMLMLFERPFESFVGAAVFALHPMRIESVVWISERKDVLSVVFLLCSLLTYVRFVRSQCAWFYWGSLFLFCLSLTAKPTALVVPGLLVLLDYWPLNRLEARNSDGKNGISDVLLEKVPFLFFSFVFAFASVLAQGAGGGLKSLTDYPLLLRFQNVSVGIVMYLYKLFVPSVYAIFYPFTTYPFWGVLLALGFIFTVTYSSFLLRRRVPELLFGWLWFLVALFPVIGIVQIGGQAYADRWSYVPHIGIILAGGALGARAELSSVLKAGHYRAGLLAFVFCLSVMTVRELPHWKDSETVFRHAISVTEDNFLAHNNLGATLDAQGRRREATYHFEEAVRIAPEYPIALLNLAQMRFSAGEFEEAYSLVKRASVRGGDMRGVRIFWATLADRRDETEEALGVLLPLYLQNEKDREVRTMVEQLVGKLWESECPRAPYTEATRNLAIVSEQFLDDDSSVHNYALKLGLTQWRRCFS